MGILAPRNANIPATPRIASAEANVGRAAAFNSQANAALRSGQAISGMFEIAREEVTKTRHFNARVDFQRSLNEASKALDAAVTPEEASAARDLLNQSYTKQLEASGPFADEDFINEQQPRLLNFDRAVVSKVHNLNVNDRLQGVEDNSHLVKQGRSPEALEAHLELIEDSLGGLVEPQVIRRLQQQEALEIANSFISAQIDTANVRELDAIVAMSESDFAQDPIWSLLTADAQEKAQETALAQRERLEQYELIHLNAASLADLDVALNTGVVDHQLSGGIAARMGVPDGGATDFYHPDLRGLRAIDSMGPIETDVQEGPETIRLAEGDGTLNTATWIAKRNQWFRNFIRKNDAKLSDDVVLRYFLSEEVVNIDGGELSPFQQPNWSDNDIDASNYSLYDQFRASRGINNRSTTETSTQVLAEYTDRMPPPSRVVENIERSVFSDNPTEVAKALDHMTVILENVSTYQRAKGQFSKQALEEWEAYRNMQRSGETAHGMSDVSSGDLAGRLIQAREIVPGQTEPRIGARKLRAHARKEGFETPLDYIIAKSDAFEGRNSWTDQTSSWVQRTVQNFPQDVFGRFSPIDSAWGETVLPLESLASTPGGEVFTELLAIPSEFLGTPEDGFQYAQQLMELGDSIIEQTGDYPSISEEFARATELEMIESLDRKPNLKPSEALDAARNSLMDNEGWGVTYMTRSGAGVILHKPPERQGAYRHMAPGRATVKLRQSVAVEVGDFLGIELDPRQVRLQPGDPVKQGGFDTYIVEVALPNTRGGLTWHTIPDGQNGFIRFAPAAGEQGRRGRPARFMGLAVVGNTLVKATMAPQLGSTPGEAEEARALITQEEANHQMQAFLAGNNLDFSTLSQANTEMGIPSSTLDSIRRGTASVQEMNAVLEMLGVEGGVEGLIEKEMLSKQPRPRVRDTQSGLVGQ